MDYDASLWLILLAAVVMVLVISLLTAAIWFVIAFALVKLAAALGLVTYSLELVGFVTVVLLVFGILLGGGQ